MSSLHGTVKFLEQMQIQDKKFFASRRSQAGTFCAECKRNTFTGLYPFWHRFGRTLCDQCGKDYTELLKSMRATDQ